MTKLMNLILDEEGATAIEYGLIAALIAAGIVTATAALGVLVRLGLRPPPPIPVGLISSPNLPL